MSFTGTLCSTASLNTVRRSCEGHWCLLVSLQFVDYRFWENVRPIRWEGTLCPLWLLQHKHPVAQLKIQYFQHENSMKFIQLQSPKHNITVQNSMEAQWGWILKLYWLIIMEIYVNLWKTEMLQNVTVSQASHASVQQISLKVQLNWNVFKSVVSLQWLLNEIQIDNVSRISMYIYICADDSKKISSNSIFILFPELNQGENKQQTLPNLFQSKAYWLD